MLQEQMTKFLAQEWKDAGIKESSGSSILIETKEIFFMMKNITKCAQRTYNRDFDMFQEDSKNVNESQRYVTVSLAVFTMRRIAFWHYSAEGFFVKYFPHLLIKFNFLIFLNMILMKSRTTTKTKADLNFIDFVLSNLMDADMYHERYIATSNMTGILGIEIVKKALLCEKLSLRVHANEQSNTGLDSIHAAHIRNICHIMNKKKANARTFVALATICPEYGELNNLVAS